MSIGISTTLTVLGIAGSLRKDSYNRAALRAAHKLAPAGLRIESFDLRGIPPYDQDQESPPPERVTQLKAAIRAADAILFGFLNMYPLNRPEVMISSADERFDEQVNLTDEATREHIRKLLAALGNWTRLLQKGRTG